MKQLNVPEEQKIDIDFEDEKLPSSVRTFRPLVFKAGEAIHVLLGPDTTEGVYATADTVATALAAWDRELQELVKAEGVESEVRTYVLDTLNASPKKVW